MAEQMEEVSVRLTNDKVQFTGVSPANPGRPVAFDYKAPLGDGAGYNGLELLLMSLAGCSGTAMAVLLRKMGKTVAGLEVKARGIRSEKPPVKFTKIFIEFILSSGDAKDADVKKAIELSEQSVCPVWQMIKNNVVVVPEYRIVGQGV